MMMKTMVEMYGGNTDDEDEDMKTWGGGGRLRPGQDGDEQPVANYDCCGF